MANTTKVDELVDDVAVEQVVTLKKESKALREEMVSLLETAVKLNATLGGSTPANFAKNFKAANEATAQLIAGNEKLIANEQKKQQAQEAALNKYLVLLSKQESARQKALNKEVADAERQSSKLIAIQEKQAAKQKAIADKQAAEQARKANVQFPASQQSANPVTQDDSPAVSYTPIITGNENMAIVANKSTEAIAAENAALTEQKEVMDSLSTSYRANLELLLALQVEQAENAAEMKELNVQDAASGERLVFLTSEQLKLKVAISQVNSELLAQAKATTYQSGAVVQLEAELATLKNQYFNVMTVEERATATGEALRLQIKGLDADIKAIKLSTGQTTQEVGAYEKAIAKATSRTQLAATAVNVATRSLIRMLVQFAFIGVIIEAATWIFNYVKALEIFNDVATSSEIKQKALTDAFTSGDYEKAIENIEKLAANLELAKSGIVDSDTAINEYNDSIGKTFGYATNLNDAQQGFIDHGDAYIQTIYLEAAAQAALANASKFAAEQLAKNVELQAEASNIRYDIAGAQRAGFSKQVIQNQKDQVKDLEKEIEDNNKRAVQSYKNTIDAVKGLYKSANQQNPGSSAGPDQVNDLRTKVANEQLEHEKIIAQNKINNDKLSYKERLNAVQDFYSASAKIDENNENAELVKLPANDARREDIMKDAANKLLQLQDQTATQRRQLLDKQYKQDQEILKNSIERQRDLFKSISDDPAQSYDIKLIALEIYNKKSQDLIKTNYDEELNEAGKNAESIKLAEQHKNESLLKLTNEIAIDKLKIQKDNLQKILDQTKESEEDQLETIKNGGNLALQALTNIRNAKEDTLTSERARGKISEKKYNEELLAINDQFAVDRIAQEIATQQAILATKEGHRDVTISRMKNSGQSPESINKFTSGANKDIQGTVDTISSLTNDFGRAKSKQKSDEVKTSTTDKDEQRKAIEQKSTELTIAGIDAVQSLRDRAFENQIAQLEKVGKMIDENAQIEKNAVARSMDTQSNKARRTAEIEAQAASARRANEAKENAIKSKQAKADKEATIAKIIAQGALAVVTALTAGPVSGEILAILTAAAVAVELAAAIATPVPSYAKGTGTGTHRGGLAIYGENGRELVEEPGRPAYYSPAVATLTSLAKGTKITPNSLLSIPNWVHSQTDNRDVVAAINENTQAVKKSVGPKRQPKFSGWLSEQRKADAWGAYTSKFSN